VLAEAGIFASGLGSGNDLEELFLTLTEDPTSADPDGKFAGIESTTGRLAPVEVLS
jgi:hypothetical protein